MKPFPILAAFIAALLCAGAGAEEKLVLGWVEKISIHPGDLELDAKVDTGADNTSIDARNVTVIDRNGRRFLRFRVDNRNGRTIEIEREQVGIEIVPGHHGDFEERPLLVLDICLGKECRGTLVNLADRSRLNYPVLLGRSFMLDRVVVNPSVQYAVKSEK